MKKEIFHKKIELVKDGLTDEQIRYIACALIGHSRIVTNTMGYINCGRCGARIGDTLGGCFDDSKCVIVDCGCKVCRKSRKTLTWKDRYLAPKPLTPEYVEPYEEKPLKAKKN